MQYDDLNQLIQHSSSSRQYFLALPAAVQVQLHGCKDAIHTAYDLHRYAVSLQTDSNACICCAAFHKR